MLVFVKEGKLENKRLTASTSSILYHLDNKSPETVEKKKERTWGIIVSPRVFFPLFPIKRASGIEMCCELLLTRFTYCLSCPSQALQRAAQIISEVRDTHIW